MPIDKDLTEAMAIHYAAAELSRRNWRVFLPVSGRVKGYDFVAWRGDQSSRVEVKGLRSTGSLWPLPRLERDVILVMVRAVVDGPPEYYIATATDLPEAYQPFSGDPGDHEWKPWKDKNPNRWKDRWDKFEK
jgi:hypothetical protein